MESKFHMAAQEANFVNSLVYMIAAFASPVLGFCVDKTGKNILWILVAVAGTIGAHSLLAFSSLTPYVAMVRFAP